MRARRQSCEQSAECNGLGEHPRLLCTLKCLQPKCYMEVYGPREGVEELEEGEIDRSRDTNYNRCVKAIARSEGWTER